MRISSGAAAFGLLLAGGCLGSAAPAVPVPHDGSTLQTTWTDRNGDGLLEPAPGEPMVSREELAPARPAGATLALFGQLADAHVTDEESPARVEMLDRLGPPFTSAFRPQEALTGAVLDGAVKSLNQAHPQLVVETGDLIDNAQANELAEATAILDGGRVDPNSGGPGYRGVQQASNPDPLYYRPDVDAPRQPGLLALAQQPFTSPGLAARWYPLPGNHDLLVQGNLATTAATDAVATGDRKLVSLDPPVLAQARRGGLSAGLVDRLLARGLPGRTAAVPADDARRELSPRAALAALRAASGHGGSGATMDDVVDVGRSVRLILLDTARRDQGAGGLLRPSQAAWLRRQLRGAGDRWLIVFSSTPLTETAGGGAALAALDRDARVVAAVAGDVHRNAIAPRHSRAGGYWMITTSSLADYPQQVRMFRLRRAGSGVVLETWMLNTTGNRLAYTSRELAYLDAQGGRPRRLAGAPRDRNARLYR